MVKNNFISEAWDQGVFNIRYCPTNDNEADIFTKPLLQPKCDHLKPLVCPALPEALRRVQALPECVLLPLPVNLYKYA